MPRPFAVTGLTVFFVLAVFFRSAETVLIAALIVFTLLSAVSVLVEKIRRQPAFPVAFASAAIACLMLVCVNEFYYYPQLTLSGSEQSAQLLIVTEPEYRYGRYYCEAKSECIGDGKAHLNLRLTLSSAPEFHAYDELSGDFSFFTLGNSDDELIASYKTENCFLGAYPVGGRYSVCSDNHTKHPGYHISKVRTAVKKSIMKMLPNDYGALALALVLGDRSEMSDEAYSMLRNCGVTHVICVSGLHISLWSAAILWILRKTGMREKFACIAACPGVVLLMLVTGMSYSVVRAGIMMLLFLLSRIISRKRDPLNSLGFALTVISCVNPYSPGSVSLRMSALATLGIILYSEYIKPDVSAYFEKKHFPEFAEKTIENLLITFFAVLFVFPVSLTVYGEFSFLVFPANLLVVPAAEACMICAVPGAAICALSSRLFNLPGLLCGILGKYIFGITGFLSDLKLYRIRLDETEAYTILCGIFVLAALAVLMECAEKKILRFSIPVLAGLFVVSSLFYSYSDRNSVRVRAFDTGNGSSVLVSYKDESVLLGCGGDVYNGSNSINRGIARSGNRLSAIVVPTSDEHFGSYFTSVISSNEVNVIYGDSLSTMSVHSRGNIRADSFSSAEGTDNIILTPLTDDSGNRCCLVETPELYLIDFFDPYFDTDSLPGKAAGADVIICRNDYPPCFECNGLKLMIIQAGNGRGCRLQNELNAFGVPVAATAGCGDIEITAKSGTICAERK